MKLKRDRPYLLMNLHMKKSSAAADKYKKAGIGPDYKRIKAEG